MPKQPLTPYLVLLGAVAVVASAAIMIRLLQQPPIGMPATLIAAGRLGLAAIILLPIAWLRVGPELRRLKRRDVLLGIAAGALLALHFDAWIASFAYTSVASSVALVSTNPLWVVVLSLLLWGERPPPMRLLGVLLAVLGSALIGFSDSQGAAPNALLGDGLALIGALAVSGYFLIGRELRGRLSLLAYIWLVYTSAAVILLGVAFIVAGGQPGGLWGALSSYSPLAYVLLLLLAIGPQLLGHSGLNWALRYLSATFITVALLGEPLGSALMALLLFGEWFAPLQLVGFVVLLVGIVAAAQGERVAKPARGVSETQGVAG
ncbi:MAG TPA: DMT family transporter [Roseiflexaceae bacterium]|nr:DMT family transporter [Roseiflexaceae bacterium]